MSTTVITVYKISDICKFLRNNKKSAVANTLEQMYTSANVKYESIGFIKNLFSASFGPTNYTEYLGDFCTTTMGFTICQTEYSNQFKKTQIL